MSKKLYPETDIQNIANAIRTLNGSSDTYTVGDMASAIALPENGYYLKESIEANPLSITDGEELNAQSCEVSFEPIQDLNGYDSPWIDSDVINKEPYLMRAVGGTATRIGNSLYDTLVGGSVVWNQLVDKSKFISSSTSDYTVTPNNDGTVTIQILNTLSANTIIYLTANASTSFVKVPANHKWYLCDTKAPNFITTYRNGYSGSNYTLSTAFRDNGSNELKIYLGVNVPSGTTPQTFTVCPQIFDLTQKLGTTIADYIYSLEQATAGSGVAYFRSLFPKDYYAYNVGQLMSVKALSHKMVGFNQFDKSTALLGKKLNASGNVQNSDNYAVSDFIPVLSATYYIKNGIGYNKGVGVAVYDSNKNFIADITPRGSALISYTFTIQKGSYIRICTLRNNVDDCCVNLHWDGERDGEYEAYEEHIYPLDSDLELRGIPKLDANNKLYYDGDTYESDGTVTRKYAESDMGDFTWQKGSGYFYSTSLSPTISKNQPIQCTAFINATSGDGRIANDTNGNLIVVASSYDSMTKEQFKTAMRGQKIVYPLATPTTETADTFQNPQLVDNWGTEEYTDSRTVQIPVGHETYQANICEISGWDGLSLNQTGKNLLDISLLGIYQVTSQGAVRVGVPVVLSAGTYTLSQSSLVELYLVDVANNYSNTMISANKFPYTFTLTESKQIIIRSAYSVVSQWNITNLQLELGSIATAYESYQGLITHTATFPSTVYGGSHDFVSGKVKSEWAMVTLNGTEDWEIVDYGSNNNYFRLKIGDYGFVTAGMGNSICDTYPQVSISGSNTDVGFNVFNSGSLNKALIAVRPSNSGSITLAQFKSALNTDNITVSYKLATPTEITLTPADVNLLKGLNTIWTDGDTVQIKYFSKSLT